MEQPTRPVFLYWLRWLQGCILRLLSGICWMQECDSNSLTCSEKRVRLEHPWPSLNRQPSKPAQIETKHDAAKWEGILCNGQRVSTLDPAATSATATWLIRYLLLLYNMTISRVDTSYRENLHYSWDTAWPCCSFGTLIRIPTDYFEGHICRLVCEKIHLTCLFIHWGASRQAIHRSLGSSKEANNTTFKLFPSCH